MELELVLEMAFQMDHVKEILLELQMEHVKEMLLA
jgi:hypothetical protein